MAITREEFEKAKDSLPKTTEQATDAGKEYFRTGRRSALEEVRAVCASLRTITGQCEDWHAQG